jgi:hypothetical protein
MQFRFQHAVQQALHLEVELVWMQQLLRREIVVVAAEHPLHHDLGMGADHIPDNGRGEALGVVGAQGGDPVLFREEVEFRLVIDQHLDVEDAPQGPDLLDADPEIRKPCSQRIGNRTGEKCHEGVRIKRLPSRQHLRGGQQQRTPGKGSGGVHPVARHDLERKPTVSLGGEVHVPVAARKATSNEGEERLELLLRRLVDQGEVVVDLEMVHRLVEPCVWIGE